MGGSLRSLWNPGHTDLTASGTQEVTEDNRAWEQEEQTRMIDRQGRQGERERDGGEREQDCGGHKKAPGNP